MIVYLSGPMSGHPQFNFPVFDEAAEDLRDRGLEVISPAEGPERELALASPDGLDWPFPETWADFLSHDVKIVADEVDAVVVLPGWYRSRGARLEVYVAHLCSKPVYIYPALTQRVWHREHGEWA